MNDSKWLDIKTAPQDGTVFLCFVPHLFRGFIFCALVNMDGKLLCMMSGSDFTNRAILWQPMVEYPVQVK